VWVFSASLRYSASLWFTVPSVSSVSSRRLERLASCELIQILECTIRDGGYAIDFQWAPEEVEQIVRCLAGAGFEYIEVGHGMGLGASRSSTPARCSDEESASLAVAVKGQARVGAFLIPGIGTADDLRRFRDAGADFVRIGTDVSRSESAWEFVELAASLGLEVFYNFMKSYAAQPFDLLQRAAPIVERGATTITVVDSAGGMLPNQVGAYVEILKAGLDARIGFHGHNNLLLANANSLAAAQAGASVIDTTLLGMGRGGGNAQTETMLVILDKAGYGTGISPLQVAKIAERFVSPKPARLKGASELELIYGFALFHSGFTKRVQEVAAAYGVPYQELILEVGRYAKENPSQALIEEVASQLRRSGRVEIHFPKFFHKSWN
jgi:4-hydroxy 2-oxovalerate aldolase